MPRVLQRGCQGRSSEVQSLALIEPHGQFCEHAKGLRITLEAFPILGFYQLMQYVFTRMTKRGVPQIVGQTSRFHHLWVNT